MKKLSNINETHWGGMVRRSSGDVKREEDKHRFDEAFKAIKDMDTQFIKVVNRDFGDVYWAPFNFGSKYINEPGYFMGEDDLKELKDYLKGTEYEIPNTGDWYSLVCSSGFDITKVGQYWSLFKIEDGKQFYLPQFGYISNLGNLEGLLKENRMYYADKYDKGFGFQTIKKMGGQPENTTHLFNSHPDSINNIKVQVRLIKRN